MHEQLSDIDNSLRIRDSMYVRMSSGVALSSWNTGSLEGGLCLRITDGRIVNGRPLDVISTLISHGLP